MFSWLSEYNPANILCLKIVLFHDLLLILLLGIIVFIAISIYFRFFNPFLVTGYIEKNSLEFLWTLIPVFLVLLIFFPSVLILNVSYFRKVFFEKIVNVVGHQWKWEYEYNLKESFKFVASPEENKNFRLLDSSGYVVVKSNINTLFNVTSDDVIHSFALPSLGIKTDAVPGRISEFVLSKFLSSVGIFTGQCSEICGILHSKMPITVVSLPL